MEFNDFQRQLSLAIKSGAGNPSKKPWTYAALAKKSRVGLSTLKTWLSQKNPQTPQPGTFDRLLDVLYPKAQDRISEEAVNLRKAYALHNKTALERKTDVALVHEKRHSLIDIWEAVMKPRAGEFSVPIRGASKSQEVMFGGFAPDELQLLDTGQTWLLPFPDQLKQEIDEGVIDYDLNGRPSNFRDTDLAKVDELLDDVEVLQIVEHYSNLYADRVISAFDDPKVRQKPYNKLKYGVFDWSSSIPSGRDETTAASLQLYRTDFFSNWVMSQLIREIRSKAPKWMNDLGAYPTLRHGASEVHMPFLTPSLGLNCFIISKPTVGAEKMCFTMLGTASSNSIQHNRLHVPVNEALNLEDIDPETQQPTLERWWRRMILEEVGDGVDLDRFKFEALNVFWITKLASLVFSV